MFTREKKLIALLLSAALVLTMNTGLFAAVGAEEVVTADAKVTSPTSVTDTSPSQIEGFTVGEFKDVSENKYSRPISINKIGGVDKLSLSYNVLVPFFGKKIPKNQDGNILGKLTLNYDGKAINIKKVKVVYLKTVSQKGGAFPTVSNASIQITVDAKDLKAKVTDKATQKAIKKALKSTKGSKKALGAAQIIVYPYRLQSAGTKPVLKGKKDKVAKIKLIVSLAGKNYTFKSGKDMFNKKGTSAFELKNDMFSVSTNDVWSGAVGVSENGMKLDKFETSKLK